LALEQGTEIRVNAGFPVDVHEVGLAHRYPRPGEDGALHCRIPKVLILDFGRGFDFDQRPTAVWLPLQNVAAHQPALPAKGGFKQTGGPCRYCLGCGLKGGLAHVANELSVGKLLLGEPTHRLPLLKSVALVGGEGDCNRLGFVPQAFGALEAAQKVGFRQHGSQTTNTTTEQKLIVDPQSSLATVAPHIRAGVAQWEYR
jgi:hypothetical protein